MINCFYCEKPTVGSKEPYISYDDLSGHTKCFREFKLAVMSLVNREIGDYTSRTVARAVCIDEDVEK